MFGSVLPWVSADGHRQGGWWSAYVGATAKRGAFIMNLMRCKGATAERRWVVHVYQTFDEGGRQLAEWHGLNAVEALQWAEKYAAQ